MSDTSIKLHFGNEFKGTLETENGTISISKEEFKPYNLLYGALGSCLYVTFLGIATKKRLTFSKVEMEIDGVKRESIPSTLETVQIKYIVYDASNEVQIKKSLDLAAQYCSIHETISKVATINIDLEFR